MSDEGAYLAGKPCSGRTLELLVHLPTPETRCIPRTIMMLSILKLIIGERLWTTADWEITLQLVNRRHREMTG